MTLIADKNLIGEFLGWPQDKITENASTLERIATAASEEITRKAGRTFLPDNGATRKFPVRMVTWEVLVGDIRSASLVETSVIGSTEWTATDEYELMGIYSRPDWPFYKVRATGIRPFMTGMVRVTGDWGWAAVPDAILQATIMTATRLLARAQSPKGVGSSFTGGETDLMSFMDFDAENLISDYMFPQVG